MRGDSPDGGLRPPEIIAGAGLDALIAYGRYHGNVVTYDEINDFMPPAIETADEIDVWLAALGAAGVETIPQRPARPALNEEP